MTVVALTQAAAEYIGIVAHQGVAIVGGLANRTMTFLSTPRGLAVAALVVVFLAFSLVWRRPPRL